MSNRLGNNRSHELRLWEIFLERLEELERLHGLDRMKVKTVPCELGFSITVGGIGYTISLPPTEHPLRVIIAQGDDAQKTLSFKETRYILLQAIEEIEGQIHWVAWDKERWAEIEADVQPLEEEDEEEQEFTEVNFGDGPGGFKAWE